MQCNNYFLRLREGFLPQKQKKSVLLHKIFDDLSDEKFKFFYKIFGRGTFKLLFTFTLVFSNHKFDINFLPKFINIINFSIAYILHINTSSAFLKKHAPFHEIERKLYLEK